MPLPSNIDDITYINTYTIKMQNIINIAVGFHKIDWECVKVHIVKIKYVMCKYKNTHNCHTISETSWEISESLRGK